MAIVNLDVVQPLPLNPRTEQPYTKYDIQDGQLERDQKFIDPVPKDYDVSLWEFTRGQAGIDPNAPKRVIYPVTNDITGTQEQTATNNPIENIFGILFSIPNTIIDFLGGLFK